MNCLGTSPQSSESYYNTDNTDLHIKILFDKHSSLPHRVPLCIEMFSIVQLSNNISFLCSSTVVLSKNIEVILTHRFIGVSRMLTSPPESPSPHPSTSLRTGSGEGDSGPLD